MSEIWDALAPEYDAWYDTTVGAFTLEVEIAAGLNLAGDLTQVSGLEVGSGTGQFGQAFARQGAWMVGVDRSAVMLDVAARNSEGLLCLCRADGTRLPFAAHTFDFVLAVTVLEFVTTPLLVLAEMWRVLRPGGRLPVGALNAWSLWTLIRWFHLYGSNQPDVVVDITNTFERKMAAIECHRSQIEGLRDLALQMSHCNQGYGETSNYTYAEVFKLLHPFCDSRC